MSVKREGLPQYLVLCPFSVHLVTCFFPVSDPMSPRRGGGRILVFQRFCQMSTLFLSQVLLGVPCHGVAQHDRSTPILGPWYPPYWDWVPLLRQTSQPGQWYPGGQLRLDYPQLRQLYPTATPSPLSPSWDCCNPLPPFGTGNARHKSTQT